MKIGLFGYCLLVAPLAACSSHDTDAARAPSTLADADVHPDHATTDGAAACELKDGPVPDFVVTLSGDVNYDGPVILQAADAGAETLDGKRDGGSVQALIGGAAPPLPEGRTLWASLLQSTTHANPYNSTTTSHSTVRASEHGAVLAEALRVFVSDLAQTPFLGASVSASPLCSRHEINNVVTHDSCMTMDVYAVTIHGDTDLTLAPASEGHVTIHGVEYDVWLTDAVVETMELSAGSPCISDWAPSPGLVLAGRAVRYGDVLR